jgi:hypothetical protein
MFFDKAVCSHLRICPLLVFSYHLVLNRAVLLHPFSWFASSLKRFSSSLLLTTYPLKTSKPFSFLYHALVLVSDMSTLSFPPLICFVTCYRPFTICSIQGFQKPQTNTQSPWRWQLLCLPKQWITFNILSNSSSKTKVAHWALALKI